jgi:hypothetical protein
MERRGEQVQVTDASLRDYTMGPLYEVLLKEGSVTVYKTLKANGENAQVSYIS